MITCFQSAVFRNRSAEIPTRLTRDGSRHRLICAGVAALLGLAALPGEARAETKLAAATGARAVGEYEVKALYLIRFLDYVVWPETAFADAQAPLVIGVLGRNPFAGNLDAAAQNRTVQKRPVLIRYGRTLEEVGACQLLFVAATEADRYGEIAGHFATQPVLLVADGPGGLKAGLTLEFRRLDNTVRFAVSLPNARQRKLELSARLLSSAVEVMQENPSHAQLNPPPALLTLGWASMSQPQRRLRDWPRVCSSEQQGRSTPVADGDIGDHLSGTLIR